MAILRRKNVNPKDVKSIAAANLTNPESVIRLANSMGITIVPFDLEMFIAKLGIILNKIIMENDWVDILKCLSAYRAERLLHKCLDPNK